MSIRPISKGNGKWLIRVSCGYEGIKKRMINKTIQLDPSSTERAQLKEAERQTQALEYEYDQGKLAPTKPITLVQLSEMFMEDYVQRKKLSPRTVMGYQQLLNSRILPALGHKRIREITPIMLNRFYSSMQKEAPKGRSKGEKLSGTYIAKYHRLLHNMLERAVQWQLLTVNPAANVDPPTPDTEEFTAYDDLQSLAMLDALENEPLQWRALITFALFSQLRRGELVALDWKDVDLTASSINVRQSAIYIPKEGTHIKTPKTKAGVRKIVLSHQAVDILKELRIEQTTRRLQLGESWIDDGAVFVQWNGNRMHVDTPTKWFNKFLKRAELPHIRFHDLRHTGASMLIASGMDIETVKKRLGHARASTTMDIYGHAFEAYDHRPADVLETLLSRTKRR